MSQGISCDSPVPGSVGGRVVDKLSQITADVCFYSCFISILWELSINKYSSTHKAAASALAAFVGLGRYLLDQGLEVGDVVAGVFGSLLDALEDSGANLLGHYNNFKFQSVGDALWAFAKGEVMRYFQPMLLASIQYMVNELRKDLNNRRRLLGEVELKLDEIKSAINSLFGYDWWEDWLQSAIWAARNVRDADRNLQRSYSDLSQGKWDSSHMGKCQDHILAAWKLLASDDDFTQFMTEVGEGLGHAAGLGGYRPFDHSFQISLYKKFIEDLQRVWTVIRELNEMHRCLVRLSGRATIQQALILAAVNLVAQLSRGAGGGIYIDLLLEDSALKPIHNKLVEIYNQMQDVIENERKTVAPIYGMQWRNELKGILLILAGMGELPAPFGLDFSGTVAAAKGKLDYLAFPHDPSDGVKSLSEYSFSPGDVGRRLQEFIFTAGNISEILTRHAQWEQRITQMKTAFRRMKQRDANAIALCDTFQGYEYERFDYIEKLLRSLGWSAAHKYLISGKLNEFMQLGVDSLGITSTAMACLSKTISGIAEDEGLQMKLNELLVEGAAEDRVALRASVALPSIQFQALQSIVGRLSKIEADMQDLLLLQNGVC